MNAMFKVALAALATAALSPFAAEAQAVKLTYLTHWSPESVAMLEKAASAYQKDHPDVSIAIRAVPFGDLLTTLRASGGGSGGATMASIYNAWLPDLAKDKLIARFPTRWEPKSEPTGRRALSAPPPGARRFTASRMKSTSTRSTTTRSYLRPPASRPRPPPGTNWSPMRRRSPTRPRANRVSG